MRDRFLPIFISIFISLIFFYQIFLGRIPFPGDSLVGNHEPYKSASYQGFVPGSVPNKAQGPDVIKQLIPWKKFTVESWKKLQIPFWNPYNFSGNPLMANFQSGVFYPGNLIFMILRFDTAWSMYILLAPVLSIYFTYLFLRRLKLGMWPSVFGGVSFAFSSYMTVWMQYGNIGHTFLWLPLLLFFTDRLLERVRGINFAGIVVASFFAVLSGYIQGLFYMYAMVITYFAVKGFWNKSFTVNKLITFATALIIPILLAMFQMLPTLELFTQSTRGNYTMVQIQQMLNPIHYLITVVAPDFFGNPATRNYWFNGTYIERVSYFGLIPLALSIFAIFAVRKRVEVKIFAGLLIFALLISTDLFVTRFFYLIPIPVLSTTVATRILSIFSFSGAILAAFGLEQILLGKNRKQLLIILSSISALLVATFIFSFLYGKVTKDPTLIMGLSVAKRNLVIPLLSFGLFIVATGYLYLFKQPAKVKRALYLLVIFTVTIFDLFYYFNKITPFSPREYMYPATPVVTYLQKNAGINRFWGYGLGYIDSNFQTYNATYSTDGNDPLHIKNYTELLEASKNGRIPNALPRPDANIAGGFGREDLANNAYRQKVINITGVKYVLTKDEGLREEFKPDEITFPPDRYKLVWQEGFWQAYENLKVTPRVLLTNNYVVREKSRALRTLFNENFDDTSTLILNEDPKVTKGDTKGSLRLISYTPNEVRVKTNASQSALLYLSDNYYPGWEARVDGEKSKIYLTNYSFRSVVVPAGEHDVVFAYQSKSFTYGLYVSILGLALYAIFYFAYVKKHEN